MVREVDRSRKRGGDRHGSEESWQVREKEGGSRQSGGRKRFEASVQAENEDYSSDFEGQIAKDGHASEWRWYFDEVS